MKQLHEIKDELSLIVGEYSINTKDIDNGGEIVSFKFSFAYKNLLVIANLKQEKVSISEYGKGTLYDVDNSTYQCVDAVLFPIVACFY